ncbi:MAG: RnfABCDGE type electron transport complex subunit D [Planctomycetes bacterium]|nr:RnfABCDGE type electron transport complex subunit D [Planctomycetota bacterium]
MAKSKWLRQQKPSRRVVLALLPCVAGGVYFFGWRSLAMVVAACAAGYLFEWIFCRTRKEAVSEAVFVTGTLFALIMPPTVSWHVIIIGMAVAVMMAKEVFGGFGRNIFNPAMGGRAFVYVCFAGAMTATWAPNIYDLPGTRWYGALNRWSTGRVTAEEAAALREANELETARAAWRETKPRWRIYEDRDALHAWTGATPLGEMKDKQQDILLFEATSQPAEKIARAVEIVEEDRLSFRALLLGTKAGTMGVTSALLILIGGVYLYWTKTASRTIILSTILSCAAVSQLLYMFGVRPSGDALRTVLSGGFLLGAFYMATDPVSSPKTEMGRVLYGVIIGSLRVIIQNFSAFNGGLMFAILIGNMFAPSLDAAVRARKAAKAARAAKEAA